MEIKLYLQMLRKGWWIILLTVLVAVNATLIYSLVVTPRYKATTKLLVSPAAPLSQTADGQQQTISSLDTLDKRSVVATYNEFLNSEKVFIEAVAAQGLSKSDSLKYTRTSIILPDANVLEVSVEGVDANVVASLANSISEKGVNYIRKFYTVYDINPIDLAAVPTIPISPNPVRDVLLAFVFGLILGCALAILSEQIRIPFESLRQTRYLDNDSQAFSRRHFNRLLELEMIRCRTNGDIFSLGFVRLDGLADFIDTMPQLILQKILQNVTQTLKKDLKGNDVVGRWNDTTFAIILPSTPFLPASKLMGKLRQKLTEPVSIGDGEETMRLEPYVGVARSKDDEIIDEFISRAQKDLDENMFNVPTPPAPVGKPVAEAPKHEAVKTPPTQPQFVPPSPAPSAPTRLSALFAAAPTNPPVPPNRPAETYTPPASQPVSPYPSSHTVSPFTSNAPVPPADFPPSSPALPNGIPPRPAAHPDDPKVRNGLYKGDIMDMDGPPSEVSQGIDDDLNEMRKHWKAN